MASLTELAQTGAGDAIGLDARQRTREFAMIVDAVTDDWYAKFRVLLPERSRHPKDKGVVVLEHQYVERKGPLLYHVKAVYGPINNQSTLGLGEWLISVSGNTGSERIYQEAEDPDDPDATRRVVGPLRYAKFEGTGPPPDIHYTAKILDGTTVKDQILVAAEGIHRPDGMDVVSGDTSITLRRTFDYMTSGRIRLVADFKKGVNDRAFVNNAFPPGTMLFVDFQIDERVGRLPNSPYDRYLYDVQLQFLYNKKGHTPEIRTDTFVADDGYESVVLDAEGKEVRRMFRRYAALDFDQLVGIFG